MTGNFTLLRVEGVLLYIIREDSNSSPLGLESLQKIQIYQKKVFKSLLNQLKIYKLSRRETPFFSICEITKKIKYGFALPLKSRYKNRFLSTCRNRAKTSGPIQDRNIFASYPKAPKLP